MGIWTWPLLGVVLFISAIGLYSTWRVMTFERDRQEVNDSPIPQAVKNHPFSLNPILWSLIAALILMFVIIAYYATSSPY